MSLASDVFQYVADLVQRRAGIQLDSGKEYLVESRLLPLAQAAGHARVDAYVRQVRTSARAADEQAVVEALTTNETSFFRDGSPFQALTEEILPGLRRPDGSLPRLRIWSAACSTGQEPYSIAMTLADALGPETAVEIVATDINQTVLDRAATGTYSRLETNRGLPSPMLVRHFEADGMGWRVKEPLRRQVTFHRHNLLDAPPFVGGFDVVFLRNVLIYFDLPVKQAVLDRVLAAMRPGGYLVLGAAETTIGLDDSWERIPVGRGAVYRAGSPGTAGAPAVRPFLAAPRTLTPAAGSIGTLPRPASPPSVPVRAVPAPAAPPAATVRPVAPPTVPPGAAPRGVLPTTRTPVPAPVRGESR
ncbi:CheR family methyltransferase [Cellulomonas fimi]|uniref:protein-glutamate O-methyltransferase n=1 Tax=Cellulomonas fimi (strain ATCC 484 / DSM 20113 / JCM 1341 / CCUG 24087 / LMG 16345 / NBRC 15513 / NCIMB 8980 / NCTC 7547 / NRS-133) TaxID=590998 RepID=F4GZC8_CELFA|nr:protein-glutamate O-methyltransferase CheR [Cellulomonas fimi]AEE44849.1 MCP methyltransferase, CheR-type [Cellulomonas fimi ATCC 484]VEH27473.1 Chemotaxis protein methyltransferase [Cellulomonas fimi]